VDERGVVVLDSFPVGHISLVAIGPVLSLPRVSLCEEGFAGGFTYWVRRIQNQCQPWLGKEDGCYIYYQKADTIIVLKLQCPVWLHLYSPSYF
jgi:hypothetical protein